MKSPAGLSGLKISMLRFDATCYNELSSAICGLMSPTTPLLSQDFSMTPLSVQGNVEINTFSHLRFIAAGFMFQPGLYRYSLDPNTVFNSMGKPAFTTAPQSPIEFDFKVAGFTINSYEALISDKHKALRITGTGLKTVTIANRSSTNEALTFHTSNIYVDLYMNAGPSICAYTGSSVNLETHPFRPHMSIYSFGEDNIILTAFPMSSSTTSNFIKTVYQPDCVGSLLFANITLERTLYT